MGPGLTGLRLRGLGEWFGLGVPLQQTVNAEIITTILETKLNYVSDYSFNNCKQFYLLNEKISVFIWK